MKKEPDVYEVEVAAAQPTLHCITAGVGDVECLTGGKANAERLIEESYHLLSDVSNKLSVRTHPFSMKGGHQQLTHPPMAITTQSHHRFRSYERFD